MLAPSLSDSIKPKDPRCLIFSPVAMSSQNKTLQISNQKPWNKKHPSFRTQSDLSMHFLIVCAKKNTAPHKSMVLSGRVTFKKKYFNFTWHRCFRKKKQFYPSPHEITTACHGAHQMRRDDGHHQCSTHRCTRGFRNFPGQQENGKGGHGS